MSEQFKQWLSDELKERHWSIRELARQTEVSHALISRIFSDKIAISCDFCIKVASALDRPPETVLRIAGILPYLEDSEDIQELIDIAKDMSLASRQELLQYARFRYRQDKGR